MVWWSWCVCVRGEGPTGSPRKEYIARIGLSVPRQDAGRRNRADASFVRTNRDLLASAECRLAGRSLARTGQRSRVAAEIAPVGSWSRATFVRASDVVTQRKRVGSA